MKISLRTGMWAGAVIAVLATSVFQIGPVLQAQDAAAAKSAKAPKPGQLSEEQLGGLLKALNIGSQKVDSRYDFLYKTIQNKEEWNLSMTTVLSQDGSSIWIMAWLDQLPKSAADVPRTALLRLLSDNDRLGNGKFFAYVATNRRFVLQRVVANDNVDAKKFKAMLDDLGASVVDSFDHWSVAAWKSGPESGATAKAGSDEEPAASNNGQGFQGAGQNPTRTALPSKNGTSRN